MQSFSRPIRRKKLLIHSLTHSLISASSLNNKSKQGQWNKFKGEVGLQIIRDVSIKKSELLYAH